MDDDFSSNVNSSIPSYSLNFLFSKNYTKKQEELFSWYKGIADKGALSGLHKVAEYYANGIGVEQSYQMAFHYYKLAAKLRSSKAFAWFGIFYEKGLGIEQSYLKALYYYKLALKK